MQDRTIQLRTYDQILIEGGAFPIPFKTIETHYPKEKASCECVCVCVYIGNVDAKQLYIAVIYLHPYTKLFSGSPIVGRPQGCTFPQELYKCNGSNFCVDSTKHTFYCPSAIQLMVLIHFSLCFKKKCSKQAHFLNFYRMVFISAMHDTYKLKFD